MLIGFLKEWAEGSKIPSHIRNYTLLGQLWHIKWFDKSDVKDLCVLFEDDLSARWFKVADKADQDENLLDEIIKVLHWVNSVSHHVPFCIVVSDHCKVKGCRLQLPSTHISLIRLVSGYL